MEKLKSLTQQLEAFISKAEKINANVSSASIGWQIEHVLLTTQMIVLALKRSKPNEYKWIFKPMKYVVFTLGKIPRGKAKAPAHVQPKKPSNAIELQEKYNKVFSLLDDLQGIENNQFFAHPFFGNLKKKDAVKFLEIHTQHHLNIVKDIAG